MKYVKILLTALLLFGLPFAIIIADIKLNNKIDSDLLGRISATFCEVALYGQSIYVPVLCGYFGIKLFKTSQKILLPTLIFNILAAVYIFFLSKYVLNSIERSLANALVGLLLGGSMVYSLPIAPLTALFYKRRFSDIDSSDDNKETI